MQHSELVTALKKPGADIVAQMTPEKADAEHMALGIAGEAAELLEAFAADEIDFANIVEEFGDLEFFMEGLRQNQSIERIAPTPITAEASNGLLTAVEIAIEAGRLLDTVKRWTIYNKALDVEKLTTSLSKLEKSMDALRIWSGISREATLEDNISKLSKRYESLSYSDKAAQDRADKA